MRSPRPRRGEAAHGIGVELHELAEAARSRLLVAKDQARAIAAEGPGQVLEIFRDIARKRRGQVVAQREPLLVIVLEGEHALVRAVLVGKELSERVGIFDGGRLERLEAIALIDLADAIEHAPRRGDVGWSAIREATRQTRLELIGFVGFVGHYCSTLNSRR